MMLDIYRLFASMEKKKLSQTIEKVDETACNKFSFYMHSVLFEVFYSNRNSTLPVVSGSSSDSGHRIADLLRNETTRCKY